MGSSSVAVDAVRLAALYFDGAVALRHRALCTVDVAAADVTVFAEVLAEAADTFVPDANSELSTVVGTCGYDSAADSDAPEVCTFGFEVTVSMNAGCANRFGVVVRVFEEPAAPAACPTVGDTNERGD